MMKNRCDKIVFQRRNDMNDEEDLEMSDGKDDIGYMIKILNDTLEKNANDDLRSFGLTFSQLRTLRFISVQENQETTQKALEDFLGVSHPTINGILKRLEEKGKITTEISVNKRMTKIVRMTEKGISELEIANEGRNKQENALRNSLDAGEKETLMNLLNKLYSGITEKKNHPSEKSLKGKIRNALYGAAVADALGVPVEFFWRDDLKKNPVVDMKGFGAYDQPKGTWSDDTSMTLCLAESIARLGEIDYKDIMENFLLWYNEDDFLPGDELFDIGCTCESAIKNYMKGKTPLSCGLSDEDNNGNGSLMRISPLPFFLNAKFHAENAGAMDDEAFSVIHGVSSLTHAHPISLIGCDIYCALMIEIIAKGKIKKKAVLKNAVDSVKAFVEKHDEFSAAFSKYKRLKKADFAKTDENDIKTSGYIVDTLEAALWCFLTTESYRECVLKAVNLGRDTDTVACVAGSIAGLYYGEVPDEWANALRNKKRIDEIAESFSAKCESCLDAGKSARK